MKDSIGNPKFPIWLIGESPPENWIDKLDTPLDPRHPARHNIWTSVLDPIQERLYKKSKLRLDTSSLYIRNALNQPLIAPLTNEQKQAPELLINLLDEYKPIMILTLGVGAFMAVILASGDPHQKVFKHTKHRTKILGEEFRNRIENFDRDKINIIPLLHTSIAKGHFLEAHKYFVGNHEQSLPNYFNYVGIKLADLLFTEFLDKPIWIK